jgi:predicted nucleotidyltransferase component of viral defense system
MTINYVKHKTIFLQILKDIYSDVSIAPALGFKGGTAAHLFYDLNRDSFDLDFDLLQAEKAQEVFEKINHIVADYGRVLESSIKKFNLLNILAYDNVSQNIKIEVSRRNFGSSFEVKTLLGIPMLVMIPADMFANKLMAMLERVGKTSRDIYDVWFFLKHNWEINKEIVESRSGLTYKDALVACINEMEKMNNRNILVGLGEALTGPQKDWARAKLKSETIFLLKARLASES